jgi:hypothetical protein
MIGVATAAPFCFAGSYPTGKALNRLQKTMTTSTSGLQLKTNRRWLADAVELVSSMRFAISGIFCAPAIRATARNSP